MLRNSCSFPRMETDNWKVARKRWISEQVRGGNGWHWNQVGPKLEQFPGSSLRITDAGSACAIVSLCSLATAWLFLWAEPGWGLGREKNYYHPPQCLCSLKFTCGKSCRQLWCELPPNWKYFRSLLWQFLILQKYDYVWDGEITTVLAHRTHYSRCVQL